MADTKKEGKPENVPTNPTPPFELEITVRFTPQHSITGNNVAQVVGALFGTNTCSPCTDAGSICKGSCIDIC